MIQTDAVEFSTCSYSQLLKLNHKLGEEVVDSQVSISVISNIVVHQLQEVLQCRLRIEKVDSFISFGNHDNMVQDSFNHEQSKIVIVFWEAFNFTNNLIDKIASWTDEQLNDLKTRIMTEISLITTNLSEKSLVIFNSFHSTTFNFPEQKKYKVFINDINRYLYSISFPNLQIVDISDIFVEHGINQLVDYRFFYMSLAPYNFDFYKHYSNKIAPLILSICGKRKKAIIFDCDNTLWGGVLGEDGIDNIKIVQDMPEGKVYNDIQSMACRLSERGIIIGLASKNNDRDVKEVFANHPHQVLRQEHIVISKCNWRDKVTNLKEIAFELNIGLDTIIFVDDSAFEINMVKEQLPQVEVVQVPKNVYTFPVLLAKKINPLFHLSVSKEDKRKTQSYKEQSKRKQIKSSYKKIDDYLKELDIEICMKLNDVENFVRLSQLTQKTNQFNLRTIRYTEQDVRNLLLSESCDLFSVFASDKFGDSGITGFCIVRYDGYVAFMDTFLLSCRVIGRKIEFKMMYGIIDYLVKKNVRILNAEYNKTEKNELVQNFYEDCGFFITENLNSVKRYRIELDRWEKKDVPFIALRSAFTSETE